MGYRTLLTCSLKGGVGKTTITIGLAQALHRKGYKIGILDADFHAPDVPVALGLTSKPRRSIGNSVTPPESNGIKVLSWAMIWPEDSAVLIEDSQIDSDDLFHAVHLIKAQKYDAAIKFITQLAEHPGGASEHMKLLFEPGAIDWGNIDYLIVDSPPESTGAVRVVAEVGNLYGAIIVCHPSRVALADIRRTIDQFRKKGVPIIGIISNQGTQDGAKRFDLSDEDVMDFAKEKGVPFIAAVPHSNNLSPYFDKIADFVINCRNPVVLEKEQVDELEAERVLKRVKTLVDLMEAFGGGK